MHRKTTLPNGLRVVTQELPHTRSATVSVYVGAGSRYEPDHEAGLSHFLEHMLFKGASRRPTAAEISEAIESAGGSHNAATDREVTIYYAKVPHTAAGEALDILCDMVRDPIMDANELEKERHVILEELAGIEDSPSELCTILGDETLWPAQPLGRNIGGTEQTVRELPPGAIGRYLKAQYVPANMVLAVAGNITHDATVAGAERWLGDMPERPPGAWFPATGRNGHRRVAVRNKATEQAHLCLSFPAYHLRHPDRFAVDVLSAILGEGMSSRLFLELREERALVYDVHSYAAEFRDAGALSIYAGCDPESARETVEVTLGEVDKLLGGLASTEVQKGRRMVTGQIQLRMEDTRSVAGWLGSQELLLDEVLTVDEVVARIHAVTVDDVVRVARDILQPARATLAVVGPYDDDATFRGLI
jgi:predicted Zn-dependent peptidase